MMSAIRNKVFFLVGLPVASVVIYALLFFLRRFDDNRLTSWHWVFGHVSGFADAWPVFIGIILVAVLSVPLASFLLEKKIPFSLALGGLAAVAFVFGVSFWGEPEVIVDSSRYFTQAKHLSHYGVGYFFWQWGGAIEPWTDMPLVPFLYGVSFLIFGESRIVVQSLTTAAFAGSVWLTAISARELFTGEGAGETGLLAGAALMSIPYLYTQIPLMLVDVSCMFFLILGFFLFQRALVRGGWGYILLASVAIFLMLISKYSQWMLVSVYGVLFLLRLREDASGSLRRGLAVAAGAALLFGVFLLIYQDVVRQQMDLLISYQRPGLRRWGESFLSTFFFQIHPFITFGAIGSAVVAFRRKDTRWIVAAWLVVLMLVMRIERSRYMIPLFPMFAITAAYGLSAIQSTRVKTLIAVLAVLSAFFLASSAYLPYLKTNNLVNLMEAGRYLDALGLDQVRVHTYEQKSEINPAVAVPLLDLYTKARIVYAYTEPQGALPERLQSSPFRFTWTYRNPHYYRTVPEEGAGAIAVVSCWNNEDILRRLPAGYGFLRRFDLNEGIFRFKPYVNIYELRVGQ